jgi:uncharacterized protein (DUF2384 family)
MKTQTPYQKKKKEVMKLGKEAFDTKKDFIHWLNEPNFHFDGKKPLGYMKSLKGLESLEMTLGGFIHGIFI